MPIYEYCCPACGREFEQLIRSQGDQRAMACPACGSREVARRPSVFAAHGSVNRTSPPRAGCQGCGDPEGRCPFQ